MNSIRTAARRTVLCGASLAVLAAALAGPASVPALAQEPAAVDVIIVSVTRREEDVQDVPASVTARTGDEIAPFFESGQDVLALAARAPSVYAESSNGRVAPRFYIRGLGNTDFDLAASQPVSVIFDDVVQENVILKSFPIFDVDQVEVFRGPQGTLFGRNTTAGIIKFDSRRPTDRPDGYVSASYGEYDSTDVEAAYGGPITDTLSFRLSGLWQGRSDWIDNDFTGEDDALGGFQERAGRLQLLFTPTDQLSILGNIHARRLDGTAAVFRANIIEPETNNLVPGFQRNKVFFNAGANNPQEYDSAGGSIKIDYDLGDFLLSSITGYETTSGSSRGDIDGGNPGGPGIIPFQSESEDGIDSLDQYTQEFRIASDTDDRLDWQAGVYLFTSEFDIVTNTFAVPPVPLTTVKHENDMWALFGQAGYDLTDKLSVSGGLRWTNDEKDLTSPGVTPVHVEDDELSWDLGAVYAVDDNVSLFTRLAHGFRGPSIQGRNIAFGAPPSAADSETSTSIEGGVKSRVWNDRTFMSATVFYYEVDDMQLTSVGGASNSVILRNADKGIGKGFEVEVESHLTDRLFVTGGMSYNDTELDDANLVVESCGFLSLCTELDPIVGVSSGGANLVNVDGNPFPQAPNFILDFTARYGIPVGPGEVFLATDWFYQGETNLFLYESAEFSSNGNFEGGLRVGYAGAVGGHPYEAAVFARNITDEENLVGGIDFDNLTGFVNDPRVIGVSLKASLN